MTFDPTKPVRCNRCNETIKIPQGWSVGAATRKHYWAKHRDVMLPNENRAAYDETDSRRDRYEAHD